MSLLAFIRFESPGYLVLLAVLPLLAALSVRSLAGLGPARRAIAVGMRCTVVLVMILALAGVQRTERIRDRAVVFVLDRSRSVPEHLQRSAFQFVRQSQEGRKPDDRVGVIAFDGAATVEQLPSRALLIDSISAPSTPDQTNISAGLRLGLALLPADAAGRLVLLSDGNENAGDVLDEAQQLSAAGVAVDILPLNYEHRNEVVFEQLKSPPNANKGEPINLQLVLRAQQRTTGRIQLYESDTLIDLDPNGSSAGMAITLEPGPNRFLIPVKLEADRTHRFRADFVPDDPAADVLVENNTATSFTVVSGEGRVLILTTTEDEAAAHPSARVLAAALEGERIRCEIEIAGERLIDQVRLADYSLVIISNVPAGMISAEERQSLAVYVRELGGGLIMVGGDDAFGAGGWQGSPVEDVMPVSFDVKQRREIIKGALCLVMHACEVPEGNYIGERAAIESVNALSSRDLIGVLAWNWVASGERDWVVPLQEVGTRTPVIMAIKRMQMGDMPDFDPLMRAGVDALIRRKDAGTKHMIVVSDFDPSPPNDDLIAKMRENRITCSTVAIGYGGHWINEQLAKRIADATGGKFYKTNDFNKVPQIFVKESRIVRRSLVQEGEFDPALVNPLSPLAVGMPGQLPQLGGLVLTTAKPGAVVPLVRKTQDAEDPVLAHWQAGLGKAVAFTSGMWSRWGPEWVSWPGFSKFWAQTARWASRQPESAAFDVSTSIQGGRARLRIDAVDKNAEAINFMSIQGALVSPRQEAIPLRLTQTGPGRYEAEFDVKQQGNYIVSLHYATGQGEGATSGTLRTGVSIAYSPEITQLSSNLALLDALRQQTGGRQLDAASPASVFDKVTDRRAERRHAMWETLLRWMLVLFLLDVAIRRIAFHPRESWARFQRFLAEISGRARPQAATEAVLTTLKGRREKVRAETRRGPAEGDASRPPPTTRYDASAAARASEDLAKALGGATQQDAPVVAKPTGKKPPVGEADYTSRLLKAKRRAREEIDKSEGNPPG